MKKIIKSRMFLVVMTALLCTSIGVYATAQYAASQITYNKHGQATVEAALNDLYNNKNDFVNTVWKYPYTGDKQEFVVPTTGKYKIETWGAQGGSESSTYIGGYGAYSTGTITLTKNTRLYIYVGGKGRSGVATSTVNYGDGGYNGGGTRAGYSGGNYYSGGGGGATHIALEDKVLSELEEHKDDDTIIIVSGGGGGNGSTDRGSNRNSTAVASGGGIEGNSGNGSEGAGATQLTGAGFGHGQNCGSSGVCDGGGAGYYGGKAGYNGAGGGSGYIGNSNLKSKHMTCYKCTPSDEDSTKTFSNECHNSTPQEDCAKEGNGYALITYIGK